MIGTNQMIDPSSCGWPSPPAIDDETTDATGAVQAADCALVPDISGDPAGQVQIPVAVEDFSIQRREPAARFNPAAYLPGR